MEPEYRTFECSHNGKHFYKALQAEFVRLMEDLGKYHQDRKPTSGTFTLIEDGLEKSVVIQYEHFILNRHDGNLGRLDLP